MRPKSTSRVAAPVVYVATDGAFVGFIALADTLRAESAEMIDRLSELGVRPCY